MMQDEDRITRKLENSEGSEEVQGCCALLTSLHLRLQRIKGPQQISINQLGDFVYALGRQWLSVIHVSAF